MPTYNKIVFNGQTLIDLSNDTVDSSDDIVAGLIGHLNDGTSVTGTASGGGGGSNSGGVKFIDYDGTVLHTYSAAQFAALTAMPANPSHTGLTSQGWNWSLADAKAQIVAQPNDTLTIGQMYVTNDGKTRIYISFTDSTRLSPYLGICPNGTVVVDWGDNTTTDTLTGTSLTTVQRVQHTYASTGDYVITLTATSGTFAIYGDSTSSNGSYLLTRTNGNIASQRCYQNAIQKVELGANASLGRYAFYGCYSLVSITMSNSITSIGNCAFQTCHSISSIVIPNGVTDISNYAFGDCFSLVSISIPSSALSIGTQTFQNCYSLIDITIPSGVTTISTSAFAGCYSLTNITIPSNVTSISNYTFQNCYSLASLTIPSGVTSIGSYAFQSCYSLASLTIPSGVTSISDYTFYGCNSLANLTIPSRVTSIGRNAFYDCYSLASLTIPSGVTSIGIYTFYGCSSLSSITIPSNVMSVGTYTFGYCYSLASLTIPSGVTSIAVQAFYNCYCIAEYHFLSTTPPTLAGTSAFTGILDDCKIYVPYSADHSVLETYQTATNWSTYASYMVEESS